VVEIPNTYALNGKRRLGIRGCLECAVPVTQQHAYHAVAGGDQIGDSIAIEIPRFHHGGAAWKGWAPRSFLKSSIPVAEENVHIVGKRIRYRQVEISIMVKIDGHDRPWLLSGCILCRGTERAIAIS
jgi:hypothetical protein